MFRSIGANVGETIYTKEEHQLVMRGPYRWIRHPLYLTGGIVLAGIGLMAENWFILALSAAGGDVHPPRGRAA